MIVAYHTGSTPTDVRKGWSVDDLEEFITVLPFLRRFGHPLYGDEQA